MQQPTFFTRQDMERIAEQDIDPALLPSDEIARQIEENDIHISVTTNKQGDMANERFASLQILDSLDEVVKPEERTRKYVCEYYSVMAHPRSCFFCEHCTDIWYDYTVGPYMFDCDSDNVELDEHGARQVGDKVRLGLQGKCNDFIDDGGK